MSNRKPLTISEKSYIISKFLLIVIALIMTFVLFTILFKILSNFYGNYESYLSLEFIILLIGLIVLSAIDFLILTAILFGRMIYHDDFGLIVGSKQIPWGEIIDVKITFGQSPVIKVKYKDNEKDKKILGFLRTYPSKGYIDSIKTIFTSKNIMVKKTIL